LKRPGFVWAFVLGIAFSLFAVAATFVWFSPKITATVVTQAGMPVSGAVVVASWTVEEWFNSSRTRQLEIVETTTNLRGRFVIPSWGPKMVLNGGIAIDEPTIRIFKAGRIPLVLKNYDGVAMRSAKSIIVSRFDGTSIVQTSFAGTLPEYEDAIQPFLHGFEALYFHSQPASCLWRKTPRLLVALERLKIELSHQGAGQSLRFAYQYANESDYATCGDPNKFLKEYRNAAKN
jgi:hypothetical protein